MEWICAFCGASDTDDPAYGTAIEEFAEQLVARELGLVYGGADSGAMGQLADAVLEQGGEVVGVIPESILANEQPHEGLTELVTTETVSARKERMYEQADGYVAFPGGIGTHGEYFDVLGQAKHGFHDKPCGLLNVAGYYDPLLAHLDSAREAGFLSPAQRSLVLVEDDPASLLERFDTYESSV